MRDRAATATSAALTAAAVVLTLPVAYLVALLAGAARRRGRSAPAAARATHFTVLVPAHDEQGQIGDAVGSLLATDYPAELRRVVVVADNCADATADEARAAGAEVLERNDPGAPGKGQAVAWALDRLRPEGAVAMVDADCSVSPNFLAVCDGYIAAGADGVQVDYVVANPEESRSAALRFAAFAVINSVRPAGKDLLGLSTGLLGTGMAFAPETLRRAPWAAGGVAEDAEQHQRMVADGLRIRFSPEAQVRSPMPLTLRAGAAQQMRWESGRVETARAWTVPLLRRAARARDASAFSAAMEAYVPPQTLLLGSNAGLAIAARVLGARRAARIAMASVVAQALFVLGSLVVVRAPLAVYRALAAVPLLVAWKVWVYVRVLSGRGASSWERTEREVPSRRSTAAR